YASPGYLVFKHGDTIYAQPFNANDARLFGDRFPLSDLPASSGFSFSNNGVMAYQDSRTETDLVWFNRSGDRLGILAEGRHLYGPELAANGKRVAFNGPNVKGAGTPGIWLLDAIGGTPSPWTSGSFDDQNPIWSPDSKQILYTDDHTGGRFEL